MQDLTYGPFFFPSKYVYSSYLIAQPHSEILLYLEHLFYHYEILSLKWQESEQLKIVTNMMVLIFSGEPKLSSK